MMVLNDAVVENLKDHEFIFVPQFNGSLLEFMLLKILFDLWPNWYTVIFGYYKPIKFDILLIEVIFHILVGCI